MFPLNINKKVIIENKLIKDYAYIFNIENEVIELISLSQFFISKRKYRNLENETNLKLLNSSGKTFKIKKFYYDEEFELNVDLEEEEIEFTKIQNLLLKHIKKYLSEDLNPLCKNIYNSIEIEINEKENIKEILDLLDKEKDISKKDFNLDMFNEKIKDKLKEEKNTKFQKFSIIFLIFFLLYAILSSLTIIIGVIITTLFFVVLHLYRLVNTDSLVLKEESILINEYRCLLNDDKEKVLVKEGDYLITKEQINKIKLKNGRIDKIKVVNENHLPEIKKILNENIDKIIKENKNTIYEKLLKTRKKRINGINNLESMFMFFNK